LLACSTSGEKDVAAETELPTDGTPETTEDETLIAYVDSGADTGSEPSTPSTPATDTGSTSSSSTSSSTDTTTLTVDTGSTTGTTSTYTGLLTQPQLNAACTNSYQLARYEEPYPTSPQLFFLGVYEPDASGVITVDIDRPGDVFLALTSYDSVSWDLVIAPGTNVLGIILSGYDAVTATGVPAGTPVDNRSPYTSGWLGTAYSMRSQYYSASTLAAISGAEVLTGASLAGYAGCYQSTAFAIR